MCFSLMPNNPLIRKNPVNSSKHVNKNLRSGIVEFFPLHFVTKDLIISEVLGSFLVVSVSHSRWNTSKANGTEESLVGELNPIT